MNNIRTLSISTVLILSCLSVNTQATTYNYLSSTDPQLVGQMAGPDLLWLTGDDFNTLPGPTGPVTGFNPNGHASGFLNFTDPNDPLNTVNSFGSIGGSFETSGNTVTSYDVFGDISTFNTVPPTISTPLTEVLTPNTTSTFTVGPNNIATSLWNIDVSSIFGSVSFILTSSYAYFNNGDDYNSIFSGNQILIDQIDFLTQFLPTNWETFFIGIEDYEFQGIQLSGQQGAVFYTVPEPSALALFGMGIIVLGFMRRRKS